MRLFILTDDTAREELGDWLKTCCQKPYGLTYNGKLERMQVAISDEEDAAVFRLAFNERIEEIATL